jgi:uncharacterized protein (TIGR00297 family)
MLHFLITIIISLIISLISFKAKFLNTGGCIAQFILADLIFGFGGIKWSIPIVTFFFLSSILSHIRKNKNIEVEKYFEKTGRRDHWQVIANGGIGGILVVLNFYYNSELLFLVYVSCISAVCADTWATEIGTLKKVKTVNILNFKTVEQGSSGGISLTGMAGTLLSAFIIPVTSVCFIGENKFYWVFLITIAGLLGSLTDSILGASIQAQYFCNNCGKVTEHKYHCSSKTLLKKGFYRVNNDVVNFITSCAGGIYLIFLQSVYR